MSVQWIVNEVCNVGRVTSGSMLRRFRCTKSSTSGVFVAALIFFFFSPTTENFMNDAKVQIFHPTDLMKQNVTLKFLQRNNKKARKEAQKRSTKSPAWFSLTQHKSNQWNNNSENHSQKVYQNIRKYSLPRFIDLGTAILYMIRSCCFVCFIDFLFGVRTRDLILHNSRPDY